MADKAKGRFVWYDLLTTDPDQAVNFYTKVVDWGTTQWGDGAEGMPPYTMWTANNAPLGGVMPLPEEAKKMGAPPHWLPYIGTPDTDATAARAQQLGGRLLNGPMDIPTVGRFAVLQDPQGAVFAVFTAEGDAPGHEGEPKVGEFSWNELTTTDYEGAFKFYSELFGWEKDTAMDMGPQGIYQMYKRNGQMLGGMMNKPAEMPGPPAWLCYTRVADVAESVAEAKRNGGQILLEPMEVPGGDMIAVGMDPQGAAFALHARKK
jgi:predicted enzyme related to lactoylglutathione lyase